MGAGVATNEVMVAADPLDAEAVVRLAYLVARRLVGAEAARDVSQETWIKFRAQQGKQGPSWPEARGWVRSVAHNAAASVLRKATAHALSEQDDPVDAQAGPAEQVETEEETTRRRRLAAALLAELPREKRDLVGLRDLEGRGWDEIARLVGEKANTLRARHSRLWSDLRARAEALLAEREEGGRG